MPYLRIRENNHENMELLARRFRRLCEKDGLFKRFNFIRFHRKSSEVRKLQREIGRKRAYRRMLRDNPLWVKAHPGIRKVNHPTYT
jgi:ribosomal protein S21